MNDLVDSEETGLDPNVADAVTRTLERILNVYSAVPDKSWLNGSLLDSGKRFAKAVESWFKATDTAGRKKAMAEIRKSRHRLAVCERKNLTVLEEELDLEIVRECYGAVRKIIGSVPDALANVSRAIERFDKAVV